MRRVLAATLFAAGCGDDPAPPIGAREELAFEILHAGMNGPYTYPQERLVALGEALPDSHADVICVQGVWRSEDREALVAALAPRFPFSLELATDDSTAVDDPAGADGEVPVPDDQPACSADDEVKLGTSVYCLRQSCGTPQGAEDGTMSHPGCLETSHICGDVLEDFVSDVDPRQRCRACFLAHVHGASSFDQILDRCRNRPGNPLAHEGQHGTMILSRLPLTQPGIHVLPSESLRRAVISATIEAGGGSVDVHCASLGPGELGVPGDPSTTEVYPGLYGDPQGGWAAEHTLQIDKLIAYVHARSGARPAVILGNFGASEGVSQDGEIVITESATPDVARLLVAYDEAVAPGAPPTCTLCPQNRMVSVGALPSWLNRIYLSGIAGAEVRESSRTYLGNVVEVEPSGSTAFVVNRVPLSLQYGFRSTVAFEVR